MCNYPKYNDYKCRRRRRISLWRKVLLLWEVFIGKVAYVKKCLTVYHWCNIIPLFSVFKCRLSLQSFGFFHCYGLLLKCSFVAELKQQSATRERSFESALYCKTQSIWIFFSELLAWTLLYYIQNVTSSSVSSTTIALRWCYYSCFVSYEGKNIYVNRNEH